MKFMKNTGWRLATAVATMGVAARANDEPFEGPNLVVNGGFLL